MILVVKFDEPEAGVGFGTGSPNLDSGEGPDGSENSSDISGLVHQDLMRETGVNGCPTIEEGSPNHPCGYFGDETGCTESGVFVDDV